MRNRGLALAVVGLLSPLLWFAAKARDNRNTAFCQTNLKQLGLSLMQYVRDYDEKAVLAPHWKTDLWPYAKRPIFDCPSYRWNYAFNRHLAGVSMAEVDDPAKVVSFFDSSSDAADASDFGASFPLNGAHFVWKRGRGTNVAFFDGHVKWMQSKPKFERLVAPPSALPKPAPEPIPQPIPPQKSRNAAPDKPRAR